MAADSLPGLQAQAAAIGVRAGIETVGADVIGLRALLLYGLKGVAAYAHHAEVLGQRRDAIGDGIARALDVLASEEADLNVLLEEALALGRCNFAAMEALDAANTGTFGTPSPSAVRVTPVAGKAILVSGHDLRDLAAILEATQGHRHQRLHPWRDAAGARLSEAARVSASGRQLRRRVAEPADRVRRLPGADRDDVELPDRAAGRRIATASSPPVPSAGPACATSATAISAPSCRRPALCPVSPRPNVEKTITVGFGRDAVLGVAGAVIEAVKSGALKHFFLIGGCDGAAPGRNYYTEFAEAVPAELDDPDAGLRQVPVQYA